MLLKDGGGRRRIGMKRCAGTLSRYNRMLWEVVAEAHIYAPGGGQTLLTLRSKTLPRRVITVPATDVCRPDEERPPCVVIPGPASGPVPRDEVRMWEVEHPGIGPAFALRVPKSAEFNADMASRVRPRHRFFAPATATWYVRREYRICLARLLKRYFGYQLEAQNAAP